MEDSNDWVNFYRYFTSKKKNESEVILALEGLNYLILKANLRHEV